MPTEYICNGVMMMFLASCISSDDSYIMIFNYSITAIVILATLIVVTETVPIHPFMKSFVLPKENIVRRYTTGQEHHHHSIANILGWHRNENVKVTLLQTILLTITTISVARITIVVML
jgi:hypothetical protein